MQTSYWAKLKAVKAAGLEPIGISIKPPFWWKGRSEKRLAPTLAMLKMSREDYDRLFFEILAKLDPAEVVASLPENACLICYERPGIHCHRRAVAEFFEKALGIEVPEFGFPRPAILPYSDMPSE